MTTDLCAYWAGTKPATGPTEDVGWVILVVILVIIALISLEAVETGERRRGTAVAQPWCMGQAGLGSPLEFAGSTGRGS